MIFEIAPITKEASAMEVAGFLELMAGYMMQNPAMFPKGLVGTEYARIQLNKVLGLEKHARLAFEAERRGKSRHLDATRFEPLGFSYYDLNQEKSGRINACIDSIWNGDDATDAVEVLLINDFVGEVKDFCKAVKRKNLPPIHLRVPRSANTNLQLYSVLNFFPCKKDRTSILLECTKYG